MIRIFMIFTFLGMMTIPYSLCLAQKTLELKPHNIIKERRPALSGITADFYTRSAYDYWVEKTQLGLPAEKEKAKHLLRIRTLYFTKEESEEEILFLSNQKLIDPAFLSDFKDAVFWGEKQKNKPLEELYRLSYEYPKQFKDRETQDNYAFYYSMLAFQKKQTLKD